MGSEALSSTRDILSDESSIPFYTTSKGCTDQAEVFAADF